MNFHIYGNCKRQPDIYGKVLMQQDLYTLGVQTPELGSKHVLQFSYNLQEHGKLMY